MKNYNVNIKTTYVFVFFVAVLVAGLFTSCEQAVAGKENPEQMKVYGEMEAELTAPPFVPRPVGNRAATKQIINMEVVEKEMEMANGVSYMYWTFDGTVPGSFIRTRVGDEIEFHLKIIPTANCLIT